MLLDEAWRRLGIAPTTDRKVLRAAYISRIRAVHPDADPSPTANEATITLLRAYETVLHALDAPMVRPPLPQPQPTPPSQRPPLATEGAAMVGNDTIAVPLPPLEAYRVALDAAHRLGDVIGVEPPSGLLQVLMELEDPDGERLMCQLLITLQGRATGITELWCAVEPLSAAPPPPIGAVTELLLDEVIAVRQQGA